MTHCSGICSKFAEKKALCVYFLLMRFIHKKSETMTFAPNQNDHIQSYQIPMCISLYSSLKLLIYSVAIQNGYNDSQ